MNIHKNTWVALLATVTFIFSSEAQEKAPRPGGHAPIGVMGDHTHKKGEFMMSYRFMSMQMEGNRIGTDEISADEIATTVPNRFFGAMGQPPTLRVVPLDMTMHMHMIGAMYAPTDKLTLMAMGMFMSSSMNHVTYQGGMGTNQLGNFETSSSGIGDTRVVALYQITKSLHANLGVSIPTGSIEEEDQVLTPMNMRPTLRLPYPMQIGSGTWDLLPALTYVRHSDKIGWGTQASSILRLGESDNEFAYGDRLDVTGWASYQLADWMSGSFRALYTTWGQVEGRDPEIMAPVQTANPDFLGGSRLDALVGINLVGQSGFIYKHRLGIEYGIPVYQDLNGPQLETTSTLTIGWQYAF